MRCSLIHCYYLFHHCRHLWCYCSGLDLTHQTDDWLSSNIWKDSPQISWTFLGLQLDICRSNPSHADGNGPGVPDFRPIQRTSCPLIEETGLWKCVLNESWRQNLSPIVAAATENSENGTIVSKLPEIQFRSVDDRIFEINWNIWRIEDCAKIFWKLLKSFKRVLIGVLCPRLHQYENHWKNQGSICIKLFFNWNYVKLSEFFDFLHGKKCSIHI